MAIDHVAAVLITRNAAETLRSCLASLTAFTEIVVYDNGSDDDTLSICTEFPNVIVHHGDFIGFGPTKQQAVSLATRDWIFSIDADEAIGPELMASIQAFNPDDVSTAYQVLRYNRFLGKHVPYGGWGNDWLVRLFNRRHCNFNDAPVHELVACPRGTSVLLLKGPLWHDAVTDIGQFLTKIQRYSELRRTQPGIRDHSALVILAKSAWAFLRSYLFQRGFLAGWRGLVIAYCASVGTFFKYMKVHADRTTAREQSG